MIVIFDPHPRNARTGGMIVTAGDARLVKRVGDEGKKWSQALGGVQQRNLMTRI